jgi:hypothetical protein
MAGTIVTDRIESDASYASSITVASPMVVSNTINMTGGSFTSNVGIGTNTPKTRLSFGNFIPANGQTLHIYEDNNTRSGLGVVAGIFRIYTDPSAVISFGEVSNSDGSTYTEHMRIDSIGRVTMPYQPVFHAQKNNGPQTAAEQVITFNVALTNIGSHYSTATSRFTAPVAGTYHFYASVLDDGTVPSHPGPRVGLRVNGSFIQKQQNFYGTTDSTFNFIHVELTLTLAANDYVDLSNDGSGGPIYGSETLFGYFGGYLLG